MTAPSDDPDLNSAYALSGPEDAARLYAGWAQTYDTDFAQDMHYVLPMAVARAYALAGGKGPVLDLGAGTGLCGAALRALGANPVDATDLSPEMLAVARGKAIYRDLFAGDLLARLPCGDGAYAGAVSSGTFTHGHVGPEALNEVLRVVRPGGWIALSVNAAHFSALGFDAALAARAAQITDLTLTPTAIYGPDATGEHAQDQALILTCRRQ